MTKIDPKLSKIGQIDPKISIKCLNYCKNPTHDLASKSYCWSPNLLGTPCLGAATISSSVYTPPRNPDRHCPDKEIWQETPDDHL